MLPGAVLQGFHLLGAASRIVPAIVALWFGVCAAGVTVAGAPEDRRWMAGLLLVTTPAFVTQAATEQADIPVAAFVAAATAILIVRKENDLRALAAAGAFASMAAWTKNEGLLYFALFAAAVMLDERRVKPVAAFLAGALPFLLLLILFKVAWAPRNNLMISMAMGRVFLLERWSTLALLIARRIVLLQAWGLHLLALLVWCIVARPTAVPPSNVRWLSSMPAAAIAAHLGILLMQPHDLTFMFKVTIDRLLLQIWPAILLLAAWRYPPLSLRSQISIPRRG